MVTVRGARRAGGGGFGQRGSFRKGVQTESFLLCRKAATASFPRERRGGRVPGKLLTESIRGEGESEETERGVPRQHIRGDQWEVQRC
jgi:hypothetical protein